MLRARELFAQGAITLSEMETLIKTDGEFYANLEDPRVRTLRPGRLLTKPSYEVDAEKSPPTAVSNPEVMASIPNFESFDKVNVDLWNDIFNFSSPSTAGKDSGVAIPTTSSSLPPHPGGEGACGIKVDPFDVPDNPFFWDNGKLPRSNSSPVICEIKPTTRRVKLPVAFDPFDDTDASTPPLRTQSVELRGKSPTPSLTRLTTPCQTRRAQSVELRRTSPTPSPTRLPPSPTRFPPPGRTQRMGLVEATPPPHSPTTLSPPGLAQGIGLGGGTPPAHVASPPLNISVEYLSWDEMATENWRTGMTEDAKEELARCVTLFRQWDIVIPRSRLNVVREVGSGGGAIVYLAHLHSRFGDAMNTTPDFPLIPVALKKYQVPAGTPQTMLCRLLADFSSEAKMLKRVGHHQSILTMLGATECPLGIITEFCAHGNLMDALASKPDLFDWPLKRRIALQIANGVSFLHSQDPVILHRDLKSLNILLDSDLNAKVSDFGLSRFGATSVFDRMTAMCGTYHWMAPEVMNVAPCGSGEETHYGPPVDVFSFAIILWELVTKKVPYDGWMAPQVIAAVAQRGERLPLPDLEQANCSPTFLTLIEACWAQDPQIRPTFRSIEQTILTSKLSTSTDRRRV